MSNFCDYLANSRLTEHAVDKTQLLFKIIDFGYIFFPLSRNKEPEQLTS